MGLYCICRLERRHMIYTFNAKEFLLYPVMKSYFELSDNDVYKAIWEGFELLLKQLNRKKVSYDSLKSALIPNQDKDILLLILLRWYVRIMEIMCLKS